MQGMRRTEQSGYRRIMFLLKLLSICVFFLPYISKKVTVYAAEPVELCFYYENVCATCQGDADFFKLLQQCVSGETREKLQIETFTYNVFLDSCKERYEEERNRLGIPQGTNLPVLVAGNQWVSGYEEIEVLLLKLEEEGTAFLEENNIEKEDTQAKDVSQDKNERDVLLKQLSELEDRVGQADAPVWIVFTTNSCDACNEVKEWLSQNDEDIQVLEYNIIEDNCLDLLKVLFRTFDVEEKLQEVPAVFVGNVCRTDSEKIVSFGEEQAVEAADAHTVNQQLLQMIQSAEKTAKDQNDQEENSRSVNILTLAGAGLLAGLNPCSISMLLMLLSLIISEKRSVWKSGVLYLTGKYVTYFAIGLVIYTTASQISQHMLDRVGRVVDVVLAILFGIAGVLYLTDAIRVFRQDYGKIRTQLPVGMRRMNHKMIKYFAGKSGMLWPVLILVLGAAISLGEFFCTGQIYMAAITYLLKDQASGVWLAFLVYVTAMSVPALCMIILIQRTRNTEHVSDFMLRHLGAIKLFNAALFFGFLLYFLIR
ncbi:MAG: GAP family protein [Oliverpabstia sp.]